MSAKDVANATVAQQAQMIDHLKGQLAAAEQRNATLTEALEDLLKGSGSSPGANKRYAKARAALKPTESGASE